MVLGMIKLHLNKSTIILTEIFRLRVPNATLRPLSELIQVYHETVGRNCVLMLGSYSRSNRSYST